MQKVQTQLSKWKEKSKRISRRMTWMERILFLHRNIRSKYVPHQGKREMEKRLEKAQK